MLASKQHDATHQVCDNYSEAFKLRSNCLQLVCVHFGRYFIDKRGELYFDNAVNNVLISSLGIGKFWIGKVEAGETSYYLLFSSVSFLMSLFLIIVLKLHI